MPQLTYAASCNDAMPVWNGIDGKGNGYLIQAGLELTTTDPYTGSCTPGQFYITPWWEVITPSNPAPETFINELGQRQSGDRQRYLFSAFRGASA